MLTEAQLRAVRWYIGDVEGDDPFWGDPKAYVTLNALFFPGIQAEQARASEGKRLNPAILEDPERLTTVLRDLLSAFSPLPEAAESCRVERYSDYQTMKQQGSSTLSFTSTSTAGFLRAYQDRIGIALMRFLLPAGTPVIDMGRMLPHYAKAYEAEILLPPGLHLELTEIPLTTEESQILDAEQHPPVVSVRAVPAGEGRKSEDPGNIPDAFRLAGVSVLQSLAAGEEPSPDDIRMYSRWKNSLLPLLSDFWEIFRNT